MANGNVPQVNLMILNSKGELMANYEGVMQINVVKAAPRDTLFLYTKKGGIDLGPIQDGLVYQLFSSEGQ
jgi:hypothetical protein